MPDLILHRLAFGGIAFEPVTDAGLGWLDQYVVAFAGSLSIFSNEDACMAGFDENTYGFDPQDAFIVIECALDEGITMEAAA